MPALDRYVPDFDINEVHAIELAVPAEEAVERILHLRAGCDAVVRTLFRLRGIPGAELPLERFGREVLGFATVEHTATSAVAVRRGRGLSMGIAFEAQPRPGGGSRLVTETRVGNVGFAFRLYWLLVGPFSALIRRRWLRSVANMSGAPPPEG